MAATERILSAMRSGEWLRMQWIARVAFGLGAAPGPHPEYARALRALRRLEAAGGVERRDAEELREGHLSGVPVRFAVPRSEWRLHPASGGER
jgi:hypothetical protein